MLGLDGTGCRMLAIDFEWIGSGVLGIDLFGVGVGCWVKI